MKSFQFRGDVVLHGGGEAVAKVVCRKICPQPLRGRWGAIHKAEAFLRTIGWRRLPQVFSFTFIKSKPVKNYEGRAPILGELDDDGEAFFLNKNCRWAREAHVGHRDV